jgi:FkbM family methyltransferase
MYRKKKDLVQRITVTKNRNKGGVCNRIWLLMFTILFFGIYLAFKTTRAVANDISSLRAAPAQNPDPNQNAASTTPEQSTASTTSEQSTARATPELSPVPEQSTDRATYKQSGDPYVPEQSTFSATPEQNTDFATPEYSPVFEQSTDRASNSLDLRNVLKTTSGHGWTMWDRQAPLKSDDKWNCRWTTFKATSGKIAPMCVHESRDKYVSDAIVKDGRWTDCDVLTKLWRQSETVRGATEQPVYVEIGTNIGSCVMEMLLATDAHIVAFEPHPRNQFCLTSTLMALSQEQRDRISFFPIALGIEEGSSIMNVANGNMGNSVVGGAIQEFYSPISVQIESLDTILNTDNNDWNIPLMRMDAQGLECHILDGMGSVFDFLAMISSELVSDWRSGQDCSNAGILDRLRAASFKTYMARLGHAVELLVGEPQVKGIADVIATNDKWYPAKEDHHAERM